MEYTHILCIKVWSPLCNCTTDYNNIESKIKEFMNNTKFTETIELDDIKHIISITWFKKTWENKINSLICGDLVADINFSDTYDPLILKHSEIVLKNIEEKFKKDKDIFLNSEIIFNIVKPLSKFIPSFDANVVL